MSGKDTLISEAFEDDLAACFPLLRKGYVTLGELAELTADEVFEIPRVGRKITNRIRMVLKLHGLAFKDETL